MNRNYRCSHYAECGATEETCGHSVPHNWEQAEGSCEGGLCDGPDNEDDDDGGFGPEWNVQCQAADAAKGTET